MVCGIRVAVTRALLAGPAVSGVDQLRWPLRIRMGLTTAHRALRRGRARARQPDQRPIVTSWEARAGLGAVTGGYIVLLTYLTVRNHYGFGTAGFDIGIFDQGVWLLSRLQTPFVTVRGLHLFGDHASFLLLALVPIYWVAASPAVLLGAQALALGAGAVPSFLIARHTLRSEWCALACATAYLAHPAVAWTNVENFHPDSFEVPLVLFAFYFTLKKRWGLFAACVGALLLVKEDVALLTFVLGLYVALRHHRGIGLATAAASVIWVAMLLVVVFPTFNEAGWLYGSRLTTQFGGVGGLLESLVTEPWTIVAPAFGSDQRWYLWQLFASFGLLSLLAPAVLVVAAGPLLSNLLATFPYQHQIEYHYSTLIVPVLTVSAILGIARFRSMRIRGGLAIVLVVAALAGAYVWGPLGQDARPVADPGSAHAQAARDAIAMIPDEAVVSSHYRYVPHLTHRTHVYEFPNPWRASNWADGSREGATLPIADEVDYLLLTAATRDEPGHGEVLRRLEQHAFRRVFEAEGVVLLVSSDAQGGDG